MSKRKTEQRLSLLLTEELSPRNFRPRTHPTSLLQISQATYSSLQTARGYIIDGRFRSGAVVMVVEVAVVVEMDLVVGKI